MDLHFSYSEEYVYNQLLHQVQNSEEQTPHRARVLSDEDLANTGLPLATFQRFWSGLRAIPGLGRLANRHLKSNAVKLLVKKNYVFAEQALGIRDARELQQIKRHGFLPQNIVLRDRDRDVEQQVQRAHQAYQFIEACRSPDHWIHQVLGYDSGLYRVMNLGNVSPDFHQLDDVRNVLDFWDDLDRKARAAGPRAFATFCRQSRPQDDPNGRVNDFERLNRLLDLHSRIGTTEDDVVERVLVAARLDSDFRIASGYLPPALCTLTDNIGLQEASNLRAVLLRTNRRKAKVIIRQYGDDPLLSEAYTNYVRRHFAAASSFDEIVERLPALAREFNRQCLNAYLGQIRESYGEDIVRSVESAFTRDQRVVQGAIHYSRNANFAAISESLERLRAIRQTFVDCDLEATFVDVMNHRMGAPKFKDCNAVNAAINWLTDSLDDLTVGLRDLQQMRREFDEHRQTELFHHILSDGLKAHGGNLSPSELTGVIANLRSALNRSRLDTFLEDTTAKYGGLIGDYARTSLENVEGIKSGGILYSSVPAFGEVTSTLAALDLIRQDMAGELSVEQFGRVLDLTLKARQARGLSTTLTDLRHPDVAREITKNVQAVLVQVRINEFTQQYGTRLRRYIDEYLKQHDPHVLTGDKHYLDNPFFLAISHETRLELLLPYIIAKYKNTPPEFIRKLLFEVEGSALSRDESLTRIKTINQWLPYLVPRADDNAERDLALQFIETLSLEFIRPHKLWNSEGLITLFSYAVDLNKQGLHPPRVVCEGIRRYLLNRCKAMSIDYDNILNKDAGLPWTITTSWFWSVSKDEQELFAQCFKARIEDIMRQYCAKNHRVYGPREDALAKLLAEKITNASYTLKNKKFTLGYIEQLSAAALKALDNPDVTPYQVIGAFTQASIQQDTLVSFDLNVIDTTLSRRQVDIENNLTIVLDNIRINVANQRMVTYGSIFKMARENVGPASAAFIRAVLEHYLPPNSKNEVKYLDQALKAISDGLDNSRYHSIDHILDQQRPKASAETIRNILNGMQKVLNQCPIDQVFNPEIKSDMMRVMQEQMEAELVKLRALKPTANQHTLQQLKGTPITALLIEELYAQVLTARNWKKLVDTGQQSLPLPDRAPAWTMMAIEVFPDLLEVFKDEALLARGQWWAKTWVGRKALPRVIGPWLWKNKSSTVTKQQRDVIVAAMPALLRILDKIDLSSPENIQSIRKYVRIIEVYQNAVNDPTNRDPNVKQFAIDMMEAMLDATDDLAKHGEMILAGIKGMANLPLDSSTLLTVPVLPVTRPIGSSSSGATSTSRTP